MQIIVTGHGEFASGFASTVKMLAGQITGVSYLDFTEQMTEEELGAKFQNKLEEDPQAVFFCDLLGGTPYKQAVLLTKKYPKIAVIAGGNIGALLEVGLQGNLTAATDAHQVAQQLLSATKNATNEFKVKKRPHLEPEDSDGI